MNRSQIKRITQEAIVLRHMRRTRNLSLAEAGARVGISDSAIAHMEHGRMEISRERIKSLVAAYGFTLEEYLDLLEGGNLPIDLRDECLALIRQLDPEKLQIIHAMLTSLGPKGAGRTQSCPSQFKAKSGN